MHSSKQVIRMLTEMVEYLPKIEEKVKSIKSEIKENVQGTNSEGMETRTEINGLDQNEEINTQPEQNEETRIQKDKKGLRNLQENFKCSNIQIIGVPEGEKRKSKKLRTYLKKIMKENFPNLAKEIDFQDCLLYTSDAADE